MKLLYSENILYYHFIHLIIILYNVLYIIRFENQFYYNEEIKPKTLEYFQINIIQKSNFYLQLYRKERREKKRRRTCSIGWSDFEVETIVCDF